MEIAEEVERYERRRESKTRLQRVYCDQRKTLKSLMHRGPDNGSPFRDFSYTPPQPSPPVAGCFGDLESLCTKCRTAGYAEHSDDCPQKEIAFGLSFCDFCALTCTSRDAWRTHIIQCWPKFIEPRITRDNAHHLGARLPPRRTPASFFRCGILDCEWETHLPQLLRIHRIVCSMHQVQERDPDLRSLYPRLPSRDEFDRVNENDWRLGRTPGLVGFAHYIELARKFLESPQGVRALNAIAVGKLPKNEDLVGAPVSPLHGKSDFKYTPIHLQQGKKIDRLTGRPQRPTEYDADEKYNKEAAKFQAPVLRDNPLLKQPIKRASAPSDSTDAKRAHVQDPARSQHRTRARSRPAGRRRSSSASRHSSRHSRSPSRRRRQKSPVAVTTQRLDELRLEQRKSGAIPKRPVARSLNDPEYRLQGPLFSLASETVTGIVWITSMPDPTYNQGHMHDPDQFIEGHFNVLNCPTHQGLTTLATHQCTITLFSADATRPEFVGLLHLSKDVTGRRFTLDCGHHTVRGIFVPLEVAVPPTRRQSSRI